MQILRHKFNRILNACLGKNLGSAQSAANAQAKDEVNLGGYDL
jgi:hypothetical protein